MERKEPTRTFSIRLTDNEIQALASIAKDANSTIAEVIRFLLKFYKNKGKK
jgi:hypothetical protein